jgi:hypothetical protein
MPPSTPPRGAASHNARAARCAPTTVDACPTGDHDAGPTREPCSGRKVRVGSYTRTSPSWDRHPTVAPRRSAFTDESTAGPLHSRIPLIAAVVLPDRDGPTRATAPRSPRRRPPPRTRGADDPEASVATNHRPSRATMNRPATGERTSSGRRSRHDPQLGRPSTPNGRRRAVPTRGPARNRSATPTTAASAAPATAVHAQYTTGPGSRSLAGPDQAAAGSPGCPTRPGRASAAAPTDTATGSPATSNASAAPAHTTPTTSTAAPPSASTWASKPLSPSRSTPP